MNLLAIDPIVEQVWFDFSTIFDSWRAIRKFGGEEQIYQSCLSQAANALDFRAPIRRDSMKASQTRKNVCKRVTAKRFVKK